MELRNKLTILKVIVSLFLSYFINLSYCSLSIQIMTALILKNLQNDFMSLGATPIEGAEKMVVKANLAIKKHDIVIAIQKWYPADHKSLGENLIKR